MRHKKIGRKFGRTTNQRAALFSGLAGALFIEGRIRTTLQKAKDLRPIAEKMITVARAGTLSSHRRVISFLPGAQAREKLLKSVAPKYVSRPGGYTRIIRDGCRYGDNAEMAYIELVEHTAG